MDFFITPIAPELPTRIQPKPVRTPRHHPHNNKKRRREQKQFTVKPPPEPQKPLRVVNWIFGSAIFLIAAVVITAIYFSHKSSLVPTSYQPKTLAELLTLSPSQIGKCDVATMNLLCAEGLVGAENVNVQQCLHTLDEVAKQIRTETEKAMPRYYNNPYFYKNYSVNQFKIMCMTSYVQNKLYWGYNMDLARSPSRESYRELGKIMTQNSQHVFIHGLINEPHMGTCSSLPVLWVSLGRRLGYPLYLAVADSHLFTRWEDSKERFNFEGVKGGTSFETDEKYMEWPFPLSKEDLASGHYLKNLTPQEELSNFLMFRIDYLSQTTSFEQMRECAQKLQELVPYDKKFMGLVWAVNKRLTPPKPQDFQEPQNTGQRVVQQMIASMHAQPGAYKVPTASTIASSVEPSEVDLQNAGVPPEVAAQIAKQSAQATQHESSIPTLPSTDPVEIIIQQQFSRQDPIIQEMIRRVLKGHSLAPKPDENAFPFIHFAVGEHPIDNTWVRYEY